MSASIDRAGREHDVERVEPRADTARESIDFGAIDRAADAAGARSGEPHLMTAAEAGRLQPERYRMAVDSLHPDRLRPAEPASLDRLQETRPERTNVSDWAPRVNPGFLHDAMLGRSGRTQNCADCARAVQDTIDGHPRVAASIDRRGLPLDGESASGEDVAYTEQWAGQRFDDSDYDSIGRRIQEEQGSAIIAALGRTGGHAFNAVWDGESVRLVDGQTGRTYPWEDAPYRQRFNKFRAIHFPGGTQP